jgi:hypothetical protein
MDVYEETDIITKRNIITAIDRLTGEVKRIADTQQKIYNHQYFVHYGIFPNDSVINGAVPKGESDEQ